MPLTHITAWREVESSRDDGDVQRVEVRLMWEASMKLAEALILRADQKKRIDQLRGRLLRNAKVQEGQQPAEKPEDLIQDLENTAGLLLSLIQRINRTNSATTMDGGGTLADAVATRDMLLLKHSIYRDLAQYATVVQDIRTKSEVKFVSTVDVAEMQGIADGLATAHRELDTAIQEMNWKTELVE